MTWISSLSLLLLAFSAFGTQPDKGKCLLSFEELAAINTPHTGISVKKVTDWYSARDIESIKDTYPQPKEKRGGKLLIFYSEPGAENTIFQPTPEYLDFYLQSKPLRTLSQKIRKEILYSIPANERKAWKKKKWGVSIQWSDGTHSIDYDHVQHVHRDQIVGSLTPEGSGTVAKLPEQDISRMNPNQIYNEAHNIPGQLYQANEGELMIINGVHYPGGGLHAAPHKNGAIASRLSIFVFIDN